MTTLGELITITAREIRPLDVLNEVTVWEVELAGDAVLIEYWDETTASLVADAQVTVFRRAGSDHYRL